MTQQDWINAATYVISRWQLVAGLSLLALVISLLLQYLKRRTKMDTADFKLLFVHLDGPRIVVFFQTLFVALGTGYTWLLDPSNAQYVPARFSFLLVATFYVHRYLVSPAGQRLEAWLKPYIDALERVKAEDLASQQKVQTVVSPTEGSQVAPAPFNPSNPQNQGR